ncbi:type II secretion system minor pseudopilin [Zobellella maritima]|uniref:general secretion pathway protein GspK n=1 Tax=Zobellella maritima TaxID=2059725 RepID=UPI000E301D21|nr:type II secretion system protein GspK [Zobellella maritima]
MTSDRQRGIALVSVLWVLMLLTLLATSLSLTSRSQGQQSSNIVGAVQARYLAEAGIQLALVNQGMTEAQRPWLADGSPYLVPMDGNEIWIAIFNESGLIDLNTAGPALLDGLLRTAGVEDHQRAELVDAIQDWRDRDDLRRLNGAEYDDYRTAARNYGPRDGPFETVEEVRQVLGMTREIYRNIRHSLTVRNPRNGINPLYAPRQVLLALPEIDETQVEQFVENRRSNHEQGLPPPALHVLPRQFLYGGPPSVNYTIYTEVRMDTGSRYRLSASLRWRHGQPELEQITREKVPLFAKPDS